MASQEDLRRIYSPAVFGSHFNERPAPDALGRRPATPLDIQRAMRGELQPHPQPPIRPSGRRDRIIPEYERLERERAARKRAAKKERNQGNGAHRQRQVPGAFSTDEQ